MKLDDFYQVMLSGLSINIRRHVKAVRLSKKSQGYKIRESKEPLFVQPEHQYEAFTEEQV